MHTRAFSKRLGFGALWFFLLSAASLDAQEPPSFTYRPGLVSSPVGAPTISLHYRNADRVTIVVKTIPDSLRDRFLGRGLDSRFDAVRDSVTREIALPRANAPRDTVLPVPIPADRRGRLIALRLVVGHDNGPVIVLDPNALVVHARIDGYRGWVFVARARDGKPVVDALVTVHGTEGDVLGHVRTDSTGVAALMKPTRWLFEASSGWTGEFWSYLDVASDQGDAFLTLGANPRGFESTFGGWTGGIQLFGPSQPVATILGGGFYKPGDVVVIASTLRDGPVGAKAPLAGEMARVTVTQRPPANSDTIYTRTQRLTTFGTAIDSVRVPPDAIGHYVATVELRRGGEWRWAGSTGFSVSDKRERLSITLQIDTAVVRFPGDTVRASVQVRDSSGRPFARGVIHLSAVTRETPPWATHIAGTRGAIIGEWNWMDPVHGSSSSVGIGSVDTLDAEGRATWSFVPVVGRLTRPAEITLSALVYYNAAQGVIATSTFAVKTAQLYLAAHDTRRTPVWHVGMRDSVIVTPVDPTGKHVSGARVDIDIVRLQPVLGDRGVRWTTDTMSHTTIINGNDPIGVAFSPKTPGRYEIRFSTRDARGRASATSITGYAPNGANDDQLHLDVASVKGEVRLGDTAVVRYTNPFPKAEAWIVIERDGVMESRRASVGAGRQEVRVATTPKHVPVVYVSVLLVATRSALGSVSPEQIIRAGSAQVRVASP